ncbi:MAG: regulatory protein RecX [Lachnospiraceae bacterium]|nr:regulatory protein RecX [Candidatus Equihabitans merdae]
MKPMEDMTPDEEIQKAKKKAMDLLLVRDRTEHELLERLDRASFSHEAALSALSYVKSYGYVNDERFARHYLEVFKESRSIRRIIYDLKNKGISEALIHMILEEQEGESQKALVRQLALKKWRTLNHDDPKSRQKVIASIARKGFRMGDILSVMEELESQSREDFADDSDSFSLPGEGPY